MEPRGVGGQGVREPHLPVDLDRLVPDVRLRQARHQELVGGHADVGKPEHGDRVRGGRPLPEEGDRHLLAIAGNRLDERGAGLLHLFPERVDALALAAFDRGPQGSNRRALDDGLRRRQARRQRHHLLERDGVRAACALVPGGNLHAIRARRFGDQVEPPLGRAQPGAAKPLARRVAGGDDERLPARVHRDPGKVAFAQRHHERLHETRAQAPLADLPELQLELADNGGTARGGDEQERNQGCPLGVHGRPRSRNDGPTVEKSLAVRNGDGERNRAATRYAARDRFRLAR